MTKRILFFLLIPFIGFSQNIDDLFTERGEIYFSFNYENRNQLNEISDIILLNGYIGKNNHPVEKIVQINLSIPLALISHLEDSNLKNITYTVISSLAASRPRDKNYVYGLSKYMLEESLLSRPTGRYIIFRSGFIRTKMTKDHKEPPFSKNPEQVAEKIINSIKNNQKIISSKYSSFQVMFLFYIFKVIPLYILNTIERKLL